jgi:HAD superfamily hydrolase (TIGR01490 family)
MEIEVNEVKEPRQNIAAFFDLDGTLVARPSMERRFFQLLRYRGEIGLGNYWLWLREAVRPMAGGIEKMLQANKMYLRGVESLEGPRLPVAGFLRAAVERVAWHAGEEHAIVFVSGTLEPLAREAARSLEAQLAARRMAVRIPVRATRLEEKDGRWTGRILGGAMAGEAKARAVRGIAAEIKLDLTQCFAYGDSADDRFLLAAVGRPSAVNPSKELAGIARTRGWPILNWEGKESVPERLKTAREKS